MKTLHTSTLPMEAETPLHTLKRYAKSHDAIVADVFKDSRGHKRANVTCEAGYHTSDSRVSQEYLLLVEAVEVSLNLRLFRKHVQDEMPMDIMERMKEVFNRESLYAARAAASGVDSGGGMGYFSLLEPEVHHHNAFVSKQRYLLALRWQKDK